MTFAVLFLACNDGGVPVDGGDPRPDMLLVVLDTVRADALGAYGNPRRVSPQFDAIAAAGALYLDATSPASWTWPSHASLFTGLPPWEHGAHFASALEPNAVAATGEAFAASPMRSDVPTLAGALSAAGYRTVSVASNHLLDARLGLVRGFETASVYAEDRDTLRAAVGALDLPDSRPLFLFVNLMGAHSPWEVVEQPWVTPHAQVIGRRPPPAWLDPFVAEGYAFVHPYMQKDQRRSGAFRYMRGELALPEEALSLFRDLYEGEVSVVDSALTTLVRRWNGSGRSDGLVAVTSDHGELLGERGVIGHGRLLWPELLHVPLAVAWPGHLAAGTRVATAVQNHALYGTLLAAAGLPAPSGLPERDAPPGPILAAEWRDAYWAREVGGAFDASYRYYREGNEAVVVAVTADGTERAQLFDLGTDPRCTLDLVAARPEVASRLTARARASIPLASAAPMEGIDPATAAMLHALGYVEAPKTELKPGTLPTD